VESTWRGIHLESAGVHLESNWSIWGSVKYTVNGVRNAASMLKRVTNLDAVSVRAAELVLMMKARVPRFIGWI